jgi:hypothetical protein
MSADEKESALPAEEWRDIPGYEGLYQVSSLGRVKSLERVVNHRRHGTQRVSEKILKATQNSTGRLTVPLYRGAMRTSGLVHRLVAITFLGDSPKGMEACHNDGNHLNNHVDNLRWGTRSDNMRDKVEHGRSPNMTGERNPRAKLSRAQVKAIREELRAGASKLGLAKKYGVSDRTIKRIEIGETWV